MSKLYIDSSGGVLTDDILVATTRMLLQHVDDIVLDCDEHGTFVSLPDDLEERIATDLAPKPGPVKRRPGRPRKTEVQE